ncbi:unnamed protein product [Plutella xylostella]|uniref:MICOS complex subunit n=1 Tax=Plutella xylostella TaxID=51655 RepID=A0A8S4E6A1_PLUXY|nr:MICOS complex subunit MIC27 [Plutella xylostella]XP_048481813.1 MICOS complex subunit MIC27 [Plutella xylostella]CAG9110961.1 unnamed protein product [Plutella xylostella]
MLRKLAVGSSLVALIPIVKAASPITSDAGSGPQKPPKMRPSELPIYDSPHADYAEYVAAKNKQPEVSYIKSSLETPVSIVREKVQTGWQHTSMVTDTVKDKYHEIQDRSDWIVKYLREEDNKEIRYGAVVMGGLTGFIFGLRGGIFRRLIYSGVGTTAMGSVCFPEETKEIARNNGVLARTYINIAYNFLYGVKPGDPQLEVKFPELSLPKDFSEFFSMVINLASSAKQAIMPPPVKEDSKPSEKKE